MRILHKMLLVVFGVLVSGARMQAQGVLRDLNVGLAPVVVELTDKFLPSLEYAKSGDINGLRRVLVADRNALVPSATIEFVIRNTARVVEFAQKALNDVVRQVPSEMLDQIASGAGSIFAQTVNAINMLKNKQSDIVDAFQSIAQSRQGDINVLIDQLVKFGGSREGEIVLDNARNLLGSVSNLHQTVAQLIQRGFDEALTNGIKSFNAFYDNRENRNEDMRLDITLELISALNNLARRSPEAKLLFIASVNVLKNTIKTVLDLYEKFGAILLEQAPSQVKDAVAVLKAQQPLMMQVTDEVLTQINRLA